MQPQEDRSALSDEALLHRYAANADQTAFSLLVSRYVNFVYSTALRQVRDRHLAEDVTQAVFLILSSKSGRIRAGTVLSNWLFCTTRYAAANALKTEARRRYHEHQSATMQQPRDTHEDVGNWEVVAPWIDSALAALGRHDREAVLLKFMEGKSNRDVGTIIGVTEEAARKRISRAVDRLRQFLRSRGVALSVAGLCGLLTTCAVEAAPGPLAAAVGGSVSGAATASSAAGLAKETLIMMAATKTKVAAIGILAVLLLTGAGGILVQKMVRLAKSNTAPPSQQVTTPVTATAQPAPARTGLLTGFVRTASGEPLGKAEVLLATQAKAVNVYSPDPSGAASTVTADDGSFSFDAPPGPCQVVVRHQLGYAHATREQLEAGTDIQLKPWGKVEGIAKIGSKPAAGETIVLYRGSENPQDPYSMLIYLGQTTTADADGHFKFDRVVPGYVMLYRRLPLPWKFTAAEKVIEVEAGKALKVALGGQGRPVIGRIALPDTVTEKIDWKFARPGTSAFNAFMGPAGVSYQFNGPVTPAPDWPKDPFDEKKKLSWEQLRIQHEEWLASPAGRKFWMEMTLETNCVINPDGTFRFEDVAVGKHQLLISVYHSNTDSHGRVAEISLPVEIGDLSAKGGQTDEPLDLGTIVMNRTPRLRLGYPAPPLTVKNLDGSQVSLAEFAGKFVLLVFWTEANRPTDKDLRSIKLANDRDGKTGKLIILTVEYQDDPQAARRLITACGMTDIGIHCTGQQSPQVTTNPLANKTIIPIDYFQTPSPITLIDPDGKVAATNLTGENIDGTIYRTVFAR